MADWEKFYSSIDSRSATFCRFIMFTSAKRWCMRTTSSISPLNHWVKLQFNLQLVVFIFKRSVSCHLSGLILATGGHAAWVETAAAEGATVTEGVAATAEIVTGPVARVAIGRERKRRRGTEEEIKTKTERRTGVRTRQRKRGKCWLDPWYANIPAQIDSNTRVSIPQETRIFCSLQYRLEYGA